MKNFLCENSKGKKLNDKVFTAVSAAKEAKTLFGKEEVIDATLGTLYDESGNLVAFSSVWSIHDEISHFEKAKYASSLQGNIEFREAVSKWLFSNLDISFNYEVIASPGGAGAISNTLKNSLNEGDKLIIPNIAWGPYKVMAREYGLDVESYNMFDGDTFNLDSFKKTCNEVMEEMKRVLVVINDPCHNPTGYSLTIDEWRSITIFLNDLSKKGSVILLNDIAYIDYTHNGDDGKRYFELFNNLSKNFLVVVAFSCSKTLTAYGQRVGAQIVISSKKDIVKEYKDACVYSARGIWSNVNNSGMKLFSDIILNDNNKINFLNEKEKHVKLLEERSKLFVREAQEIGLEIYPHKEGFFTTLKIVDDKLKVIMMEKLRKINIFTVMVDKGLRIALCSIPLKHIKGLAKKIFDCLNEEI